MPDKDTDNKKEEEITGSELEQMCTSDLLDLYSHPSERVSSDNQQYISLLIVDHLEQMSVSELLHTQMTHPRKGLPKELLRPAQRFAFNRIKKGEEDILRIHQGFKSRFFGNDIKIKPFTNYLDYLMFLWKDQPTNFIQNQYSSLDERARNFLDKYPIVETEYDKKSQKKGGFIAGIDKIALCIEVVYSNSNPKSRPVAVMFARRKDTDRAIEKMAYRLVMKEENERRREKNSHVTEYDSEVIIDDWFGYNLAAYRMDRVYEVKNRTRDYLTNRLGFKIKEVDDHYKDKKRKDGMIQIKCINPEYGDSALREVVVTDIISKFVDEADHISFRARQQNDIKNFTSKQREKFERYVRRGKMLFEYLPKQRQRVLADGTF
jgi:hypothetical protein